MRCYTIISPQYVSFNLDKNCSTFLNCIMQSLNCCSALPFSFLARLPKKNFCRSESMLPAIVLTICPKIGNLVELPVKFGIILSICHIDEMSVLFVGCSSTSMYDNSSSAIFLFLGIFCFQRLWLLIFSITCIFRLPNCYPFYYPKGTRF